MILLAGLDSRGFPKLRDFTTTLLDVTIYRNITIQWLQLQYT